MLKMILQIVLYHNSLLILECIRYVKQVIYTQYAYVNRNRERYLRFKFSPKLRHVNLLIVVLIGTSQSLLYATDLVLLQVHFAHHFVVLLNHEMINIKHIKQPLIV